ncbi:glycerophosphodiester phosphodiesterase family protein [Arcicella aquatica]|uniref:Glycerophosphodiester phosphodiesterase family protein n=1 Tax=Arcicella aquatica TaxID=217141 RepID=A0ABU5QI79_9BACT|nr:glycerophosphodiester phosphodiesterase family protein [Arcicella aquatica]MEA5256728.1 glycerophosphodiester phosphodiesterase family protein [Arcicella aquatica]
MQQKAFEIEGHRGCRGLMPENTILAFKKALDLGVETLELDVCITKDQQVVVSHEPYINALFSTHPNGLAVTKKEEKSLNLYHMTYEEISRYDTGLRGNRFFPEQQKLATNKPLLNEMLAFCEGYIQQKGLNLVHYNIEIKSEEKEYGISQPESIEVFAHLVYQTIIQYIPFERVIIQSFDFNVLRFWHQQIQIKQYDRCTLSALVEREGIEPSLQKLGFIPDVFSPYFKQLTKGKVAMCHQKGMKVIPWTVNETSDMLAMKNIGTDGLITDYPDRALKLWK